MINKTPRANLRHYDTIFMQIGIIISLLLLILLVRIEIRAGIKDDMPIGPGKEITQIVELPVPIPPDKPAPPKPMVTIEVPDITPVEDFIEFPEFEFNTEYFPLPSKSKKKPEDNVLESNAVEFMPELIGGQEELYSKIIYPEIARKAGIQGRVTVSFIVNQQGEVKNLEIIRGIGGGCDQEVLRVMKEMRFSPGVQNGRLVSVKMVQSVNFQLKN